MTKEDFTIDFYVSKDKKIKIKKSEVVEFKGKNGWHHIVHVPKPKGYQTNFLHEHGFTIMQYDENLDFIYGYSYPFSLVNIYV